MDMSYSPPVDLPVCIVNTTVTLDEWSFLLGDATWNLPNCAICLFVTAWVVSSLVRKKGDTDENTKTNPRNNASIISKLVFWWMTKPILAWYKTPLKEDDFWELDEDEKTMHIYSNFDKELQQKTKHNKTKQYYTKSAKNGNAEKTDSDDAKDLGSKDVQLTKLSIIWALAKVAWRPLMLNNLLLFVQDSLDFVAAILQGLLIGFVDLSSEERATQPWRGYFYAGLVLLSMSIARALENLGTYYGQISGMQVRSCLMAAVYKKALTISNGARRETTVGEIVNLMSTDVDRLRNSCHKIRYIWGVALTVVVSVYMLYQYLGPPTFVGLGFLILIVPVSAALVKALEKMEEKEMELKDGRIKLLNEVLNGIKVLKLYAWELSFKAKLCKRRNVEEEHMIKTNTLKCINDLLWGINSFCLLFITLVVSVLIGNPLSAEQVFVALPLFNMLEWAAEAAPDTIAQFVTAKVSLERLLKFFMQDDISEDNVLCDVNAENTVEIIDGNFAWDGKGSPVIKNINMSVKPGSLVAVVGSVGAGKSTLLSAILGETEKISGLVTVNGTLAYTAQQAWLQNATLKDNILFHSEYDERKYEKVLDNCCLRADIAILPGADTTEIGEKGINLSGGQKQRVSLARAVYREADIYLLDDPLSAVDAHVGKHIFDKCIGKNSMLKDKTRILVTHGLHWLPHVDHVLVVSGGTISESGSYQELLERDGDFAQILKTHSTPSKYHIKTGNGERADGDSDEYIEENDDSDQEEEAAAVDGHLVEEENTDTAGTKWSSLLTYLNACGVRPILVFTVMNVLYQASSVAAAVCLERWTADSGFNGQTSPDDPHSTKANNYYLGGYGLLGVMEAIIQLLSRLYIGRALLRASSRLHDGMLHSILRAPMTFFDTTPSGRILNRFSGDVSTMDDGETFHDIVDGVTGLLSCVVIVTMYTSPMLIVFIIVMAGFYFMLQRVFVASSRHLRRLVSSTASPIFAHFSESIAGATTIRAYGMQETFCHHSAKLADHNMNVHIIKTSSEGWMYGVTYNMSELAIFGATLFALQINLKGGAMGIVLTYSLEVCIILKDLIWYMTHVENHLIAVDRISEYSNTKPEAECIVENTKPPLEWPQEGTVKFCNFATRYREGLDLVVKDININIKGGEKIGIVGRTGAGKSSLTMALFRIIESAMGEIQIDDIALHKLGLHQLRSKLTILPQDPVLFSGTLRMNLDPFDQYSDKDLNKALDRAHLKNYVDSLEDGLDHECGEGGNYLSFGQRQLVCLARTLLRKTKILILDEATAAVDLESDDLIQNTIRTEFADCTVLTIAHRLITIMDSDRVLVLSEGQAAEFDSPANLLAEENSIFAGMVEESRLQTSDQKAQHPFFRHQISNG